MQRESLKVQDIEDNRMSNDHITDVRENSAPGQLQPQALDILNTYRTEDQSNNEVQTTESQNQTPEKKEPQNHQKNRNVFQKRRGTSGIRGQLYETKLLTLILFRALNDEDIEEFVLGTNIADLGAMDDIVVRYKKKSSQKSKIIFIQAKHRDDPTKDKLTVEEILKQNGDFSVQKYFGSYLKIDQIFGTGNDDLMFQNKKDLECEFVIYTPVEENFTEKTIVDYSEAESLIKTKSSGKIFQFDYNNENIKDLVECVGKSRVIQLAKIVAKIIQKDNFKNIMNYDIIKQYHVYLAQNVIITEDSKTTEEHSETFDTLLKNKDNCYCISKFRHSFLTSKDDNLLLMKRVLCEELADLKRSTNTCVDNKVDDLESLEFKLPIHFGNRRFCFYGSDIKQQKRLDHMCSIIKKLTQNISNNDSEYTYIKLDEYSVGSDNIVQRKDLGTYWLGGLVGNLLIYDHETKTLKFNLNEQYLSTDNIKILKQLEGHSDLSKFRFDINVDSFPKLTLCSLEQDRKLVCDFLGKLKFYTNQAKEDEVEDVIKEEIKSFHFLQNTQECLHQYKHDLIYLKVHDYIQKWWKQPHFAPYLTKTCDFYLQAERDILDSPLINIINYIYRKEMENIGIQFDIETIKSLQLDMFINSDKIVLLIFTDDIIFSSIKVIQYFDVTKRNKDCIFIDLDSIITKNSFETLKHELKQAGNPVLVVTSREQIHDIDKFHDKLKEFIEIFKGKIIIIALDILENGLSKLFCDNIVVIKKDSKNTFSNFLDEIRRVILEERKIIFQGVEVNVSTVFNDTSLDLLSAQLLRELICKGSIEIGRFLTVSMNFKTIDFYAHRSLRRCITLNTNKYTDKIWDLGDQTDTNLVSNENIDLVITTESAGVFEETCKNNKEANVHWFQRKSPGLVWKQSCGDLHMIIDSLDRDSLDRDSCEEYDTLQVKTVNDIQEKVVIVSAGSGMGKSTLLGHLAINTKRLYPSIWVITINLLDNTRQLCEWKERAVNINLVEAMKFLYSSTISYKDLKNGDIYKTYLSTLASVNHNELYFADEENKYCSGVDLSEILLVNYYYNNNKLAVLLDGFDEISPDYSYQVRQLLCTLKASKITHLWLTSRPCSMLDQLELALGTFSFSLNPLTHYQQGLVLQNIWSKRLVSKANIQNVHFFYNMMSKRDAMDGWYKFTSIPLHLSMIAEVFEDCFRCYLSNKIRLRDFRDASNLIMLYEKFTNIKFFNIRFGQKKHTMNTKDPDVRKIIDKERKLFIKNHKIAAAYLLLDKSRVFSDKDVMNVQEFMDDIKVSDETSEIIECIIDNHPKFIHYTFAEYFAVEHFFDRLKSVDVTCDLWEYFLDELLTKDQFMGIRRFINSKLEINPHIITEFESTDVYRSTVFNILLAQYDFTSDTHSAISVAFKENLDEIVIFLLKCVKTFLNKDNLSDFLSIIVSDRFCVFCTAVKNNKQVIIKNFIKLVTDIDRTKLKDLLYCQIAGKCSPHFLSLALKTAILDLSYLGMYDIELLFEILIMRHNCESTPTPAHSLGTYGYQIKFIWDSLKKLKKGKLVEIFNVTDNIGQTPLHYAAIENDYDFFIKIYELLGVEDFRKVCIRHDSLGFTPICAFAYDRRCFNRLKIILEIVYDEPDVDVKDFVFNKLDRLHPKDVTKFTEMGTSVFNCFKTKRDLYRVLLLDPERLPRAPIGWLAAILGY